MCCVRKCGVKIRCRRRYPKLKKQKTIKKIKKNKKNKKKRKKNERIIKKKLNRTILLLLLYKINNKQRDAKNTIYKKQPKIKKKSIGIPVIYMCVLCTTRVIFNFNL